MPHAKLEDLPNGNLRWPAIGETGFRSTQWGDMEVGYTTVHAPLDCTEQYKFGGLPGGVCPCPHYGFLFEGRMRAKYPGSDWPDEVVEAGEAFFIPSARCRPKASIPRLHRQSEQRCGDCRAADPRPQPPE